MVGDEDRLPADVRGVVDRMSDRDWQSLTLQLGRYAVQKSRRFYWRTGSSGELPYGEMTESIVSKAYFLWLTGRRRWNPVEYQDLKEFLKGVIDSLLSHSANGYDNRRVEKIETSDSDQPNPSAVHVARDTPESALIDRERATEADEMLAEIVRQLEHDLVVLEIIAAMRNGAVTRRDIVKATGRSPDVIDNGLKRLRRAGSSLAQRKTQGKSRTYEDQTTR
jgi:hypothetical protein